MAFKVQLENGLNDTFTTEIKNCKIRLITQNETLQIMVSHKFSTCSSLFHHIYVYQWFTPTNNHQIKPCGWH